jgi:phage-related protein
MAADFNAGSIEGTLDLDSTPFAAGLARAKQQAQEFEGQKIEPGLGLKDDEFKAKKTVANTELDKFDHKKATAKADLDISEAVAKYAILSRVLDAGGFGKGATSVGLMTGKIGALVTGIMSAIAIMGPLGSAVAGVGAAGITAFGGIALSLGLFAAAAKSAFGEITAANKAGVTLTGMAGEAQSALKGLTDQWGHLVNSVKPEMFHLFAMAFGDVAAILPKLTPLLRTVTMGISGIVDQVAQLTRMPIFDHFLASLQRFMGGFLSGAGPVLSNLLDAFMHAFIALQPLMAAVGHGIAQASAAVDSFSQGGAFHAFIHTAVANLPIVMHLLGSLLSGVQNLVGGLAPLAGPAIGFIENLVKAVGHLNIRPLAKGLGDVLTAVGPLLPVLGKLVNTVLGPLGHLLSGIAKDAIVPLTTSLSSGLHPAFQALHTILHALVQPLSLFAGSIANLANPTGVHLVTALLTGLSGIVVKLAPPFGRLAVALESVIDTGINAIIPLLPTATSLLGGLAGVAVVLANGLAAILEHKAVVYIILGIVGAIKAYELGVAAITAVTTAFGVVTGIIEAVEFGWAGLTVAQDASTASMVANKVGMIAWKAVQLAGAAASGVMTAAQWALNAAMDANPIGLVVIAIAALAAGLIYAYKHSETFRNIVNGAFNAVKNVAQNVFGWLSNAVGNVVDFIRNHWVLLLSILTGPIGAAAIFIITHFSQIRDFISGVLTTIKNDVSNGLSDVFGFFRDLPGRLLGLGGQFLNAGKSLMESIFHGLESAAGAVGGFAANIANAIWSELKSVLNNILPHQLHISIPHAPDINVPLFPMLAKGGVTDGMTSFIAGDNPGGREAVIPLDKYDIPKKGQTDAAMHQQQQDNGRIISLLSVIAQHLAGSMPDDVASALGDVLSKQSDATSRRQLQMARAL